MHIWRVLIVIACSLASVVAVHAGELQIVRAGDALANLEQRAKAGTDGSEMKTKIRMLRNLVDVNRRIRNAANVSPSLQLLLSPDYNAYTDGNDVFITIGILEATADDADALGALLGHEYAHILGGHKAQKINALKSLESKIRKDIGRGYVSPDQKTQIVQWATTQLMSYSRAHEDEADDVGISIAAKAGFDPRGFQRLAATMLELNKGNALTHLADSHPGWLDRHLKTGTRISDEEYLQRVDAYVQTGNAPALKRTVDEWLRQLPDSGKAWYHKAEIQRQMRSMKSVASFENAFLADSPPINTSEQRFRDAWAYMCTGLFREGFRWESLWCIKRLKEDEYALRYAQETGQNNFIVAGDEPQTLRIKFETTPGGGKLLRYDGGTPEVKPTPAWRGVRYQAR
ncbi:M48 family metalloprotease [Dechloromonas denitrificans]|uniref:M48 family metalloprotease n=1 Tax=Dechloromonas denitrificans TaxID=281362 RepID=UPI001CF8819E|nr:M48 family metalloprotease [Dechloromonas denitrificans]UCV05093.1 M48 family metalloprotease [Dechloromonas denitrificans]